jgi:tRNA pseudouridine55 synthase
MFYLVNKPKGITSFFALKKIRTRLGIKKIGHTGTLDPLASGLLLVATEESTKLIAYLEKANKSYRFTMRMDGWTESGDLEKEVQPIDSELIKNI